jgi:hypothetical protein
MLGDTMTSARKPEIADRTAAVAAPERRWEGAKSSSWLVAGLVAVV